MPPFARLPPDPLIATYHNAVRHECTSRIARAHAEYDALHRANRATVTLPSGAWHYTDEAYATFPRYLVLEAILTDVERMDPAKYTDLDEARAFLSLATQTAANPFTVAYNAIAARVMAEERSSFVVFVETSQPADWEHRPRMPYRRGLDDRERDTVFDAFEARWGRWYGGVGSRLDIPAHATITASRSMNDDAIEAVRIALESMHVDRVFELREWGESYERELAGTRFQYTGAEGVWCTRDLDWMIYASHEDTVTFGGDRLIAALREVMPLLLAQPI